MKLRLLIVITGWCIHLNLFSQEISEVSLFEQNQTYYNPGSIGNQEVLAANFFYRAQWIGFSDGTPSTQVFCAHAPLRDPSVAMGVTLEHDALGSINYTGFYVHYAYRLTLGGNKISFGLKGGITSLSQDRISLRDNPDPLFDEDNQTSYVPNFGVGILFYGRQYWAGISVPRLFGYKHYSSGYYGMDPDIANYEYVIMGGGRFPIGSTLSIDPSAMVIFSTRYDFRLTLMGTAVYKKAYKAGIGFRLGEAVFLAIGYQLNRQFSLGYSYDFNIGETYTYASGSHEINIGYKFGYKVNASNPRGF